MKYALLIYGNEAAMQAASKADIDQTLAAYRAYAEAMTKAGVLVERNRLQTSTLATTVRIADGKTQVLDGPYAETKEQLGGYIVIDVPDLDAALSWATRCPGANRGVVEVRPVGPCPDVLTPARRIVRNQATQWPKRTTRTPGRPPKR
jgi:hypothetical protein